MGSQTGSQRRQASSYARPLSAIAVAGQRHIEPHRAPSSDRADASYKRDVTGSNPVAPTTFPQLDGIAVRSFKGTSLCRRVKPRADMSSSPVIVDNVIVGL